MDRFEYGYDRASNRIWRRVGREMPAAPSGKDEFYTYDGLHRLASADRGDLTGTPPTGVNDPTFKQAWKDSNGNLTLESLGDWRHFREASTGGTWDLDQERTHNAVNEITGITGGSWAAPAYDAAGNMTSGPKGDAPMTKLHFKWDAWNRMVAVFNDNNGSPGTTRAEYQYDGRNYRIVKLIPNGNNWDRTDYYYNDVAQPPSAVGWQCLEERFASNQASKDTVATASKVQWLWDQRYIDAPVCRWRDDNDDGDFADAGETLYYCNDANMNVTALVDAGTGGVVERYVYDPYGKPTIYSADWANIVSWANSKKNERLYCGYRYNLETGLYYVNHRYYHPRLAAWTTRDPKGNDANLLEYVRSMPGILLDPTGTTAVDDYVFLNRAITTTLSEILHNCFDCAPCWKARAQVVYAAAVFKRGDAVQALSEQGLSIPGFLAEVRDVAQHARGVISLLHLGARTWGQFRAGYVQVTDDLDPSGQIPILVRAVDAGTMDAGQALGRANQILQGASGILSALQQANTTGDAGALLTVAGTVFNTAAGLIPVRGVNDLIGYYGRALTAIGPSLTGLQRELGEFNLSAWELCRVTSDYSAMEGSFRQRAWFSVSWAEAVLADNPAAQAILGTMRDACRGSN